MGARVPCEGDIGRSFAARQKLKMREQCELTSTEAGELPTGTEVQLLAVQRLADGTLRAHVACGPSSSPAGWVSCVGKDGGSNLIATGGDGVARDTQKPAAAAAAAGSSSWSVSASVSFAPIDDHPSSAAPAATAGKPAELYRGGSLVKLHGTKEVKNLEKFDGRMGRVVEMQKGWSKENGLVAVLLDSRPSDHFRGAGTWVAVPPDHLKDM